MTNMNSDRETLRELADEGNGTALDRLADMADTVGDLAELGELLDEGSMRAGLLLTRRAVATGDLRELQRISDAGYDQAGNELDRLLEAPAGGTRTEAPTGRQADHETARGSPQAVWPTRRSASLLRRLTVRSSVAAVAGATRSERS